MAMAALRREGEAAHPFPLTLSYCRRQILSHRIKAGISTEKLLNFISLGRISRVAKVLTIHDLTAFQLCGSHPLYAPMSLKSKKEIFDRCDGKWKRVLRFLQCMEQSYIPHDFDGPDRYQGTGIRIEDEVLITETGYEAVVDEGRSPTRYEDPCANMEGFPQNNGGGRGRNNHTLESPSETFEQQPTSSWKGVFSISFYTQYFNVDTDVVINRSMSALSPTLENFSARSIPTQICEYYWYGPIWIATTLVFALTALGNCGTYLMEKHSDTTTSWSFDVSYMNVAACSIYGYVIVVPLGFYFLLQDLGSGASLIRFWCMWGYSLSILILSCFIHANIMLGY